jgi:hypothetical protein
MIPWELQADELVTCNCAYGCPCQFNALPTHGHCETIGGFGIEKGYFGETRLDGLNAVVVAWWPGAIHHGGGKAHMIIDERADGAQRSALLAILSGEETEPGATVWNVFASTFDQVFDPVFAPVELDIDVDERLGRIVAGDIAESRAEPIRNPVTGATHRARIELPDGFEYNVAEIGSATSSSTGPIAIAFSNSYAQFAHIHLNNRGVVKRRAA